jgi:hypothetical protein
VYRVGKLAEDDYLLATMLAAYEVSECGKLSVVSGIPIATLMQHRKQSSAILAEIFSELGLKATGTEPAKLALEGTSVLAVDLSRTAAKPVLIAQMAVILVLGRGVFVVLRHE